MTPQTLRARRHYAALALQAAQEACVTALRRLIECPYRNSSTEYGVCLVDAIDALDAHDAATLEVLDSMFAE